MEQLNKNDLQNVVNAIDTHVRANGLSVSEVFTALAKKIHDIANAMPDAEPAGDSPGGE